MQFSATAYAAFAVATSVALGGGTIELLDSGNTILGSVPLNTPAGVAAAGTVTFSGFPKQSVASQSGTVASARYRTSASADYGTAMTVGLPGSGAEVEIDNGLGTLVLAAGQLVTITTAPTLLHAPPP